MRVLVVTNMYPSLEEPWAGCFVKEQIDDLVDLGLDVSVCRFDGRADRKEYLRAGARLRRLVADDAFDLVHAHYGLTGAVALAQRRVPIATTFHGSDTVIPWQRSVSWAVARLTTPVFVSDAGRRQLGRGEAAVIPCGVDLDRFRPRERVEARRELGWDAKAPYVVFPGSRRNSLKRADLFDAAVREARRELPGLLAVALEGLTRNRTALTIAAADVTLMTSDWEGSPVSIKESLACQTPVVSVPVGDVPSVIAGLPGCAICARDVEALAEAVVAAVHAPRSVALRERAQLYARPEIARRVRAVYDQVVTGRDCT